MNTLRKIAACIATWLIAAHPALALNDTIGVTTGSGKTANLIAFAGGNVISEVGICDATTANQCAAVGAGGALLVTGTGGTFPVSGTLTAVTAITNALPAGTNVIGHVIADTGSTTAVTGTVTANATLSAETTKVIGTVNLPATPTTNLANIDSQTSRLVTGATRIAPGSALATTSFVVGSRYVATPPTFTDGQEGALQIDSGGRLLTSSRTFGAGGVALDAATGAAVPANALQVGMAQGGNLIAMTGTSGNLNVQCANCSGSGVSTVDAATFTATTSLFAGSGGFFQTTATNNALTTGQQGMFQVTANRALFSNLRNAAGAEVGVAAVPLQVSLANTAANGTAVAVSLAANQSVNTAQWATTSLGVPTAYGTAPTTGNYIGVNAFVTNATAPGQATMAASSPVVIANNQSAVPVSFSVSATGGATISSAIAPATPAGVNLKASAGTVYSVNVTTVQATPIYVKLYNASSAPTCGSGTPVARFMVPSNATAADGAGTNISFPVGLAFGTGIGYCVTGALADNDTTAITATNTLVNISWN